MSLQVDDLTHLVQASLQLDYKLTLLEVPPDENVYGLVVPDTNASSDDD